MIRSLASQLSKDLSEIQSNLANPPALPHQSFADAVKTAIPPHEDASDHGYVFHNGSRHSQTNSAKGNVKSKVR